MQFLLIIASLLNISFAELVIRDFTVEAANDFDVSEYAARGLSPLKRALQQENERMNVDQPTHTPPHGLPDANYVNLPPPPAASSHPNAPGPRLLRGSIKELRGSKKESDESADESDNSDDESDEGTGLAKAKDMADEAVDYLQQLWDKVEEAAEKAHGKAEDAVEKIKEARTTAFQAAADKAHDHEEFMTEHGEQVCYLQQLWDKAVEKVEAAKDKAVDAVNAVKAAKDKAVNAVEKVKDAAHKEMRRKRMQALRGKISGLYINSKSRDV